MKEDSQGDKNYHKYQRKILIMCGLDGFRGYLDQEDLAKRTREYRKHMDKYDREEEERVKEERRGKGL